MVLNYTKENVSKENKRISVWKLAKILLIILYKEYSSLNKKGRTKYFITCQTKIKDYLKLRNAQNYRISME